MKMKEYAGSTYLKVEDLRAGPRVETIASIGIGGYDRPEATFASGDILSLNKTNVRTLIRAFGDDSRDWMGCQIELRIDLVDYNGQKTDSILVRPITPPRADKAPASARPGPAGADPDDEIPF